MKEFSKEVYLQWYADMTMWRRFEDKCRSLYLKQKIRGFYTYTMAKKLFLQDLYMRWILLKMR